MNNNPMPVYSRSINYLELYYHELFFGHLICLEKKYSRLESLGFVFKSLKRFMVFDADGSSLIRRWQSKAQRESMAENSSPELNSIKAEAREALDKARLQLEPVDYFLLRMVITEDEKEWNSLFGQAEPYLSNDLLSSIVMCFIFITDENIIQTLNDSKAEAAECSESRKYRDLFELASLIHDFSIAPEKVEIKEGIIA